MITIGDALVQKLQPKIEAINTQFTKLNEIGFDQIKLVVDASAWRSKGDKRVAVPYEKIESVYRDTDIFLFPSLVESFGHPLVEAMASGLPIIASDTTVNREICGDAAVYFDPQNASDFAQSIMLVREDVELRSKLRENGLLRVRTIFDWEQHVTRLIDVFNQMEPQVQVN